MGHGMVGNGSVHSRKTGWFRTKLSIGGSANFLACSGIFHVSVSVLSSSIWLGSNFRYEKTITWVLTCDLWRISVSARTEVTMQLLANKQSCPFRPGFWHLAQTLSGLGAAFFSLVPSASLIGPLWSHRSDSIVRARCSKKTRRRNTSYSVAVSCMRNGWHLWPYSTGQTTVNKWAPIHYL